MFEREIKIKVRNCLIFFFGETNIKSKISLVSYEQFRFNVAFRYKTETDHMVFIQV